MACSHSIYKGRLRFEAMHSALRNLIQKVVERNTEQKYLKNLGVLAGIGRDLTGTYRIHVTKVAGIYKTAGLDE